MDGSVRGNYGWIDPSPLPMPPKSSFQQQPGIMLGILELILTFEKAQVDSIPFTGKSLPRTFSCEGDQYDRALPPDDSVPLYRDRIGKKEFLGAFDYRLGVQTLTGIAGKEISDHFAAMGDRETLACQC